MTGRSASIVGGAAIAATLTGAAQALTSIGPLAIAGSGVLAIALAATSGGRESSRGARAAISAWPAIGAVLGLLLPTSPPPAAGPVMVRAAQLDMHGDLFDILDALDRDPRSVVGRVATVSGSWSPSHGGVAASVSRRVMSCCAADAVDVGFDVETQQAIALASGAHVRVRGIVTSRMRDGELRYVLERSTLTALEDR